MIVTDQQLGQMLVEWAESLNAEEKGKARAALDKGEEQPMWSLPDIIRMNKGGVNDDWQCNRSRDVDSARRVDVASAFRIQETRMIVCITAEDRAFLKACGIAQDVRAYVSQRRESVPDQLEQAIRGECLSDPQAAE